MPRSIDLKLNGADLKIGMNDFSDKKLLYYPNKIVYTPSLFYTELEPSAPSGLRAWTEFLAPWKVGGPMPVLLHATQHCTGIFVSATIANVADVNNGTVTSIVTTRTVPTEYPDDDAREWVHSLIRELYCHEMDEQITVHGQRIFDPHKK